MVWLCQMCLFIIFIMNIAKVNALCLTWSKSLEQKHVLIRFLFFFFFFFFLLNLFTPEFLKWTLPSLNLTMSIVINGEFLLKIINPCHTDWIKMPRPLLIVSQSDYLIQIVHTNSHTKWQTVQIQISWLLQKPSDLDLHCLQRQGISGFSRTRVNRLANSVDPDEMSRLTWLFTISTDICNGLQSWKG